MAALRSSPILLLVAILSVVAGAAAGLLGVGSPTSPPLTFGGNYHATLPLVGLELLLASPLIALAAILVLSIAGIGGDPQMIRPTVVVFVIVGAFLLVVLFLIHPAAVPASTALGPGIGAPGDGVGPGSGNGTGGHGTGGNGSGLGGTGTDNQTSGSKNNTTKTGGTGGSTGSNNSTGPGTGNPGNDTHNGTGRSNTTIPILAKSSPPTTPRWVLFVLAAIGVAVVAALAVPGLATRPRRAAPVPPAAAIDPRAAVASAISEAAAHLTDTDPRDAIGRLYRTLLGHLEPVMTGKVQRTPEEVRDLHLLPLGVRPVAADYLTRLFEVASYSSHPLGAEDVTRAREALRMAETDLRASRGAA